MHFSQRARTVTSLRELPDISAEFKRQKLDIVDVGEKSVPFDIDNEKSKGLPHREFVRDYVFSDKIIVWYYRGGFGTSFPVVEFKMQRGTLPDETPMSRLTGRTLSRPLCAATNAMLAGVTGRQGW